MKITCKFGDIVNEDVDVLVMDQAER